MLPRNRIASQKGGTIVPLLLPWCSSLSQASQIRCEIICTSHVMEIWFGFILLGNAMCQHRVCSHVCCIPRVETGAQLCYKSSRCSPQKRTLELVCFIHLSGSKTRGDSSQGIWDMAVPCRVKLAASQAPVTGNLTQITKGSTDCVWHVHTLPSDAMSLFCRDYLCVAICIFV